jgi:hypothetical protein
LSSSIRDAIFEHEMFRTEARVGGISYPLDHIRRVEATWSFAPPEVSTELEKMDAEQLVQGLEGGYWQATAKGLLQREQRWQQRGLRHPALIQQVASPADLVLALAGSAHEEIEGWEPRTFVQRTLFVYLWRLSEAAINETLVELIHAKFIRKIDISFNREEELLLTADGQIRYATQIVPQLGLTPPYTILAPQEGETPPFNGAISSPELVDNLRYRWEEAERCRESRAWLGATIIYGSILEAILIDLLASDMGASMRSSFAPKDKQGGAIKIGQWKLEAMLDVAVDLGWIEPGIAQHGHTLRDTRNLVHPAKQIRERSTPNEGLVTISRTVIEEVMKAIAAKKAAKEAKS